MLQVERLDGLRFLDIGSGSGLSSLAARRLGARVHSFDYDAQSVACTSELRRRYFPADDRWTVERGSALDADYLRRLGQFDIVYSWGVLHHTGQMWHALENAVIPVAQSGKLFIAIYNDTGTQSRRWHAIKRIYNEIPKLARKTVRDCRHRSGGSEGACRRSAERATRRLRAVVDRVPAPARDEQVV
jgi:2-polyprenyl-6-hydroxyphenyl methylase/3-demethylubiquinone-9 3-methyltransferase